MKIRPLGADSMRTDGQTRHGEGNSRFSPFWEAPKIRQLCCVKQEVQNMDGVVLFLFVACSALEVFLNTLCHCTAHKVMYFLWDKQRSAHSSFSLPRTVWKIFFEIMFSRECLAIQNSVLWLFLCSSVKINICSVILLSSVKSNFAVILFFR
jgi:hypothetical protein